MNRRNKVALLIVGSSFALFAILRTNPVFDGAGEVVNEAPTDYSASEETDLGALNEPMTRNSISAVSVLDKKTILVDNPPVPLDESVDSAIFGSVTGYLYDSNASPIPRGRIVFGSATDSSELLGATASDANGLYRLKISAGTYRVYSVIKTGSIPDGMVFTREVFVEGDRESFADLFLPGDQSIVGGFYCPGHEKVLLYGEVRQRGPEGVLVATMSCVYDDDQYAKHLERMSEESPDIPYAVPAGVPGRGGFHIKGLANDHYYIRVFFDTEKKYFTSTTVDLTKSGLQFANTPISLEDFVNHREIDLLNPAARND